jgi:hypothetical protein
MPYSKLLTLNQIACGGALISNRCTGHTTGQALGLIGEAMENPGKRLFCSDCIEPRHLQRILLETCRDLVGKLGLLHVEFNTHDNYITYNIWRT